MNGGSKPPPRRPSRGGGDEPPDLEEVCVILTKAGSLFGSSRKPREMGIGILTMEGLVGFHQ